MTVYEEVNSQVLNTEDDTEIVVIFVPAVGKIVKITEGSGDNLLPEDEEEGLKDYVNYDIWSPSDIDSGNLDGEDGGMVLFEELIREKYSSMCDTIPNVLDMAFDNAEMPYILLAGGKPF